jgi:hypothetical protein
MLEIIPSSSSAGRDNRHLRDNDGSPRSYRERQQCWWQWWVTARKCRGEFPGSVCLSSVLSSTTIMCFAFYWYRAQFLVLFFMFLPLENATILNVSCFLLIHLGFPPFCYLCVLLIINCQLFWFK